MATDNRTSNFLAGRDLACEVLTARSGAIAIGDDTAEDDSSIEAQYRLGRAQNNWVLPFLDRLRASPELAEGFAAVLSDFLPGCGGTDVGVYAELDAAEIFGEQEASHV